MCLDGRLSPSQFEFRNDGTTLLKLAVLEPLMNMGEYPRMIGQFAGNRPSLITDQLAGTVHACMGFVQEDGVYVPNTALREDTRDVVKGTNRIIAIMRKEMNEPHYTTVTSRAKGSADLLSRRNVVEWAAQNMEPAAHAAFYSQIHEEKEAIHKKPEPVPEPKKVKKRSRGEMDR
jgi:hypothetical protein